MFRHFLIGEKRLCFKDAGPDLELQGGVETMRSVDSFSADILRLAKQHDPSIEQKLEGSDLLDQRAWLTLWKKPINSNNPETGRAGAESLYNSLSEVQRKELFLAHATDLLGKDAVTLNINDKNFESGKSALLQNMMIMNGITKEAADRAFEYAKEEEKRTAENVKNKENELKLAEQKKANAELETYQGSAQARQAAQDKAVGEAEEEIAKAQETLDSARSEHAKAKRNRNALLGTTLDGLGTSTPSTVVRALETRYYADQGESVDTRAYDDLIKAQKEHAIPDEALTDRAKLIQALETSGAFSPLLGALRSGVIDQGVLDVIIDHKKRQSAEVDTIQNQTRRGHEKVKTDVEKNIRSFSETMVDGWKNLNGYQKLGVIAIGAYLTWLMLSRKEDSGWVKTTKIAALSIPGFFLLGGPKFLKGTIFGAGLDAVDEGAGWYLSSEPNVTLDEKTLGVYARFLQQAAGEEIGSEMESFSYVAQMPLATLANAFTLEQGGAGGRIDMKNAAILAHIQKSFGSGSREVLSRLRRHNINLSDGLAHVFYMLGAIENPAQHAEIEKARAGQSFDSLTGKARDLYSMLANRGKEIAAGTKHEGKTVIQLFENILKQEGPAATPTKQAPGASNNSSPEATPASPPASAASPAASPDAPPPPPPPEKATRP